MEVITAIAVIVLSSAVIYFAGNRFAEVSSKLGDHFRLPKDVKGATFDAISSSLPELLVALYSVIFFHKFEVGVGTIAGSALFNLLIIPGICVFVAPIAFKVSKRVISRDAFFYLISVFVLIVLLLYFKSWGIGIALILLMIYLVYLMEIRIHTKQYQKSLKPNLSKNKISKEITMFFFTLLLIGGFTFLLTKHAIILSNILGVSPIIIAFTVIAAATSVPDTVISIINSKKGNIDDATSNVFGSNTFNISVGLGLPLLIYYFYKGAVAITFVNIEIILGLLGATILVLYFFVNDGLLGKKEAVILLLMYLIFLIYVITLSFVPV